MGRRGFAPKPTKLRLLHGDQKSRINTDEPPAPEGGLVCPSTVDPQVREIWDYTVTQLKSMGIDSSADRDALLAYCEAVVVHRKASALLAEFPLMVPGSNGGLVKNPAVAMQREAANIIKAYAHMFGLTPSARSEISKGAARVDSGQSAARYLNA
jgi:P27 family predicted phage terminase small subunit